MMMAVIEVVEYGWWEVCPPIPTMCSTSDGGGRGVGAVEILVDVNRCGSARKRVLLGPEVPGRVVASVSG
jgi:hypothetical protein